MMRIVHSPRAVKRTTDMPYIAVVLALLLLNTFPSSSALNITLKNLLPNSLKVVLSNARLVNYNPICLWNIAMDTKDQTGRRSSYDQRSEQTIADTYLRSYREQEQGRGVLNRMSVMMFPRLSDHHLMLRFMEHFALLYCHDTSMMAPLATRNTRMGQFQILAQHKDDDGTGANFMVVYEPTQKLLGVVFRGTQSKEDVKDAVNDEVVEPTDVDLIGGEDSNRKKEYRVHRGFWNRFLRYRQEVQDVIKKAIGDLTEAGVDQSTLDVVLVGHSLGCPWSMLTAADIVTNLRIPVHAVYQFSGPLMANQVYADDLAKVVGEDRILRVVFGNDLVVHVGLPEGAHPQRVTEYYAPFDPVTGTISDKFTECTGDSDKCSRSIPCEKWSWMPHSEFGGLSARAEFCRLDITVPNSVYDAQPNNASVIHA